MFESFRAGFAYRPTAQKVAVIVAGVLVVGAVGVGGVRLSQQAEGLKEAGAETAASLTEKPAKHQMFGVVFHTYSERNETSLLDQRLYNLATAALQENAQLTLYLGDDAPEVRQEVLISRKLTRKTDNEFELLPPGEREAIRDETRSKLSAVPPAPATSVSGSLRLLASLFDSARRSKATQIVGWLVGDTISTVKECNFYVADMSPSATDDTARRCLGDAPIDLGGAEVRLVGAGQDRSKQTDSEVSVGTVAVVSRMIELAHGVPRIAYLDGGPTGVGLRP